MWWRLEYLPKIVVETLPFSMLRKLPAETIACTTISATRSLTLVCSRESIWSRTGTMMSSEARSLQ